MWTNRKHTDIDTNAASFPFRVCFYFLFAAAILFNGWILEGFVYTYQAWSHMWISEVEIASQPWSWLFRGLDASSYVAMLLAAILGGITFIRYKGQARYWIYLAFVLVGAMALLGFFDITHSLDCVRYQHPACLAQATTHTVSRTAMLHGLESHASAAASMLFGLIVIVIIRMRDQTSRLYLLSIIVGASIIGTLSILAYSDNLFVESITQRGWNVLVSLQLIVFAYHLRARKHTQEKQIHIYSSTPQAAIL
jgi:hypothetical protein